MPKDGLEPSRGCPHWILNPARLPIPPLRPDIYYNKKLLVRTISTSILKTVKPSDHRYYQHNKNISTEVYMLITVLQLCSN